MHIDPPISISDKEAVSEFLIRVFAAIRNTDEVVYVGDTPAIEYILNTIPLSTKYVYERKYGLPETVLSQLLTKFYQGDGVQNKYQCQLDGTPTQCVDQLIDALARECPFIEGQYFSDQESRQWRSMVEMVMDDEVPVVSDRCKIGDDTVSCVEKMYELLPSEFPLVREMLETSFIAYVGKRAPDAQCRYPVVDGESRRDAMIPCVQRFLMDAADGDDGDYWRRFGIVTNGIAFSSPLMAQFGRPIFQHADGTVTNGYDWLLAQDEHSGGMSPLHVLRSMKRVLNTTDGIFSKLTCHATDGTVTSCIDAFIDTAIRYRDEYPDDTDTLDEGITEVCRSHGFDAASTCRYDGSMVPCLFKIGQLAFHEDTFALPMLPTVIRHTSTPLSQLSCRGKTCLEYIVDYVTTEPDWEFEDQNVDIIASVIGKMDLQHDTCGGVADTCMERIMSSADISYLLDSNEIVDELFDTDGNIRADPSTICDGDACREALCSAVTSYIDRNGNRADITPKMLINIGNVCGECSTASLDAESRSCYDNLCFSTMGAYDESEWLSNVKSMKYRWLDDPHDLCGVYNVTYVSSDSVDAVTEYREKVRMQVYSLQDALLRYTEDIRIYDHTTQKATVIPSSLTIWLSDTWDETNPDTVIVTYSAISDGHIVRQSVFSFANILSRMKMLRKFNGGAHVREIEAIVKNKPSSKPVTLKMVISTRPNDLLRASSCQGWSSCFNVADGAYRGTIHSIIDYGGYIAYLASDEYAPSWLARVYLIPCESNPKCVMIQNESRNYAVNEMYATVLYDAVYKALYDAGFNTDECSNYCKPPWWYEFLPDRDEVRNDLESDNYDDYRGEALNICIQRNWTTGFDAVKERIAKTIPDDERYLFNNYPNQYIESEDVEAYLREHECSYRNGEVDEIFDEIVDEAVDDEFDNFDDDDVNRRAPDGYASYLDTKHCRHITDDMVKKIDATRGKSFVTLIEKMADRSN